MTRLIGRFTLAAALAIAATVGLAAESWAVRELLPGKQPDDRFFLRRHAGVQLRGLDAPA